VRITVTKFGKSELATFLHALDRKLGSTQSIVVIGGAAAALNYDSGIRTSDVDVMTGFSAEIAAAAVEARRATGLAVAVGPVTVADPPVNYEDRLKSARGLDFERLAVFFPDKYDLALMKMVRGYQHDLDAIEGIHRRHRLSMRVLVDRFEAEMGQAIADPRKLRLNMAMLVARLYGLKKGQAIAEHWGVLRPKVG
jgi:hypothetical protein